MTGISLLITWAFLYADNDSLHFDGQDNHRDLTDLSNGGSMPVETW